jgi:hypothetical protein
MNENQTNNEPLFVIDSLESTAPDIGTGAGSNSNCSSND